jgi:hypothetical protein
MLWKLLVYEWIEVHYYKTVKDQPKGWLFVVIIMSINVGNKNVLLVIFIYPKIVNISSMCMSHCQIMWISTGIVMLSVVY